MSLTSRTLATFLLLISLTVRQTNSSAECKQHTEPKEQAPQPKLWHHSPGQQGGQGERGAQTQPAHVAILPLGSIEYHGPHLPLGTDALLAEKFAAEASHSLSHIAVLPPISFGTSFEHANFPGSIPIRDANFNGIVDDIIAALAKANIQKVILVNAHGGQTPNVDIAVRNARFNHNVLAVSFNVQAMMSRALLRVSPYFQGETEYGIHAGLIETSVMLHWFPELVHRDKTRHFKPRWSMHHSVLHPHSPVVSYGWRSEDLSEFGALGDAKAATPELGLAIAQHSCETLLALIQEVQHAHISNTLNLKYAS